MTSRTDRFLSMTLTLLLALGLASCSSDDDPTDPGGGGGDTQAPRVMSVSPDDGTLMVPNSGTLTVEFDEAMDPIDASGEITMSHGTLVAAEWVGDASLTIEYDGWPAGLWVSVALGTGFKDVAGNPLAGLVVVGYGTWSDDLAMFETSPATGATDINRSAPIILDFIAPMQGGTIESGITIADDTKAVLPFRASSANQSTWVLTPDEDLPANSGITVTIGTSVMSIHETSYPDPYSITFTTNDQIDETPPTIVSLDPASGSTMPATQQTLVVTFSEAVNPDNFRPVEMNGQLLWLIDQAPSEPWWNATQDVLTVPLPSLPAGLELEAVFADYEDFAGNVQTEETPWEVTVEGSAKPYPLRDGQRYMMIGEWMSGPAGSEEPTDGGEEYLWYQVTERTAANQWNIEEWSWDYTEIEDYDIQQVTSSAISLVGFTESDLEEIMLGTPAIWAELPLVVGNSWSQSLEVDTPEGTIDVDLEGEVVEVTDLYVGEPDGIDVSWTNAWLVRLELELSQGGTPFALEIDETWYVPGIGMVRNRNREDNLEPGEERWQVSDVWLNLDEEN